jgi:hypothetical protein
VYWNRYRGGRVGVSSYWPVPLQVIDAGEHVCFAMTRRDYAQANNPSNDRFGTDLGVFDTQSDDLTFVHHR